MLIHLYRTIGEVSLPDLENGVFIHPAEAVIVGLGGEQPTEAVGSLEGRIVVFGSDGGGALISITEDGKVYKLKDGGWVGGTYTGKHSPG
jgi:hypothetical protein